MTPEEYRKQLLAEPCECVSCADCGGSGRMDRETGSFPEWEPEPCDMCSGGVVEVCDRCCQLEELEHDDL